MFTSQATLMRGLLVAPAIAGAVLALAATAWIGWVSAALVGLLALVTASGIVVRLRRPVPLLRLSPDGFEGAFGLIAWQDVTGAEIKTRLGVDTHSVVVRVRPKGWLLDPTREFVEDEDALDLRRDRFTVATGRLDIDADELVRRIELYRALA